MPDIIYAHKGSVGLITGQAGLWITMISVFCLDMLRCVKTTPARTRSRFYVVV